MIWTTWFQGARLPVYGLATALLFSLALVPAHAALVYVDAGDDVGGNTTLSDGSTLLATDGTGATTWRQRDNADYGSNGGVFEGVEPSPLIKTSVSGLASGIYDVYVHFWDPQSTVEDWNVRAGLTNSSLNLFSREGDAELAGSTASVLASTLDYVTAPTLFGPSSSRDNLAGYVGQAVITNGTLDVFVDDLGNTDVNLRTWYDGISYEMVTAIPEPTSVLLVALALGGGILFRARQSA